MNLKNIKIIGHQQPLKAEGTSRSSPDSLTNTSSNATAVNSPSDRSKFKLIFCEKQPGNYCFIHCFCCLSREKCWPTEADCKLNCPACDPKCPPQILWKVGHYTNKHYIDAMYADKRFCA